MDKDESIWSRLWFLSALGVFVICTAFGAILFGTYGYFFPKLSGVRDDWNVFGALLGAFGSCIGAVATLATLLFLAHQNRQQQEQNRKQQQQNQQQQEFIEWQVKTQTFQNFLTHSRVFRERLVEIQSRFDDNIRFPEVESIYFELFPHNGAARVDLTSLPEASEVSNNLLGNLKAQFERLDSLLEKTEWTEAEAYDLATQMFKMVSDLGFEWVGESADGDIVTGDTHTGINIYSLHEALRRMRVVYNTYLRFTGNPEFTGLDRGVSSFVSEAMMQCRRLSRFLIYNSIPCLRDLQKLYFDVRLLRNDSKNLLLPDFYGLLQATFESSEDVAKLNDVEVYASILIRGIQEINEALSKLDEDDKKAEMLNIFRNTILNILENLKSQSHN